jgi:uncharacterized membrane protein (UPF0127 family)
VYAVRRSALRRCGRGDVVTPGTVTFANGATAKVVIAEKPEDMARGLMDRTSLPEDEGMIFWLQERRDHAFWMKRTKIALDLVFIDRDTVVGVLTLQPLDENRHRCGRPSTTVLEVNGGWCQRHGVSVGEKVQITLD